MENQPIPPAVTGAIYTAWPDQAVEICRDLRHYPTMGCYGFNRWGMFVGVEYDGYIHT